MPKYRATDPDSGLTVELDGDTPPTESDFDAAFKAAKPAVRDTGMSPNALATASARAGGGGFVTTMGIPASDQIAAQAKYVRAVPPIIAGAVSAPLSVPAGLALMGAAGLGGSLASQGMEKAAGKRDGFSLGETAADTMQAAVPLFRAGSLVKSIGANAVAQGATAALASKLRNGEVSLPETAVGTVLGGGATAARPVVEAGIGAAAALRRGVPFARAIREGGAQAFRPLELTPAQIEGQKARDIIEATSGDRPDTSLSEAINAPHLTRQMNLPPDEGVLASQAKGEVPMRLAAPEMTPEDLSRITRSVSDAASKIERSGRGRNEIAREAFDALEQQGVELTEPVVRQVNRLAGVVSAPPTAPLESVFNGGRRSVQEVGSDLSELVGMVHGSAQKEWNQAYEAARSLPEYAATHVPTAGIDATAQQLGMQIAPNAARTGFTVVSAPLGSRSAIAGASDLPAYLTLDQARGIASELSGSIRRAGVLPGVDTRHKAQLLDALQADIQRSVAASPALEAALGSANKMYAENIGRFRNSFAKGMLRDVGEQGGATPESVIRKLTGGEGSDAETNLNELLRITGQGATAGHDASPEAINLLREGVLSQAGVAGREGGLRGLDKAVSTIEKLPESVQKRLFPDLPDMRQRVNVARNEIAKLGISDLPNRDAFDVFTFVTDPRNTTRVRGAMDAVRKANPSLAQDVRGVFMDHLMDKASVGGKIDPAKLSELIQEASSSAMSKTPGVGGTMTEAASTVLGPEAVRDLRKISSALSSIPTPVTNLDPNSRGFWNFILTGNQNTSVFSRRSAMQTLNRIFNASPAIRYRVAATILSDDSLRRMAMQPRSGDLDRVINQALGIAVQKAANEAEQ